jgi:medium-chain acyl-[acyl-carrier-protein] hydrolase
MSPTSWFLRTPGARRPFRLYCFCYAGGSAATFLPWQQLIHPNVEICAVQLPGRGTRFHEAPYTSFEELVERLTGLIAQQGNSQFAFFGHSLGGLLAFEVTRSLRDKALATPSHLFISGCDAARYRSPSKQLHLLDDKSLLQELKTLNGTPTEVLANDELMALILPTIRADFALAEGYRYRPRRSLLDIPMSVLAGKLDPVDAPEQVVGWNDETTGPFEVRWFDGDHFFIHPEQASVLDFLNARLQTYLDAPASSLLA